MICNWLKNWWNNGSKKEQEEATVEYDYSDTDIQQYIENAPTCWLLYIKNHQGPFVYNEPLPDQFRRYHRTSARSLNEIKDYLERLGEPLTEQSSVLPTKNGGK